MKKTILILLLFAATLVRGAENELVSGEYAVIDTLGEILRSYAQNHHGKLPGSWNDLKSDGFEIDDLSKNYNRTRGVAIEEKYTFVDGEFDIPQIGQSDIVLIRTAPINFNQSNNNRRLFIMMVNGKVGGFGVSEQEAEKMFVDAGKNLPGKGNSPDFEKTVEGKKIYMPSDLSPVSVSRQTVLKNSTPQGVSQSPNAVTESSPRVVVKKESCFQLALTAVIGLVILSLAIIFFWRKKRKNF